MLSLAQDAGNVIYLSGTPERKGWLVLEMPWAAPRTVWSCCLIPCQCRGRNMHEHRRKPRPVQKWGFLLLLSLSLCFVVGSFLFGCWVWFGLFFCFFLRLSFSSCSDPCSLSLPMLRGQERNRRNWKKGERSEVPLLEKACMSWESRRLLSQGVGQGAQSHARRNEDVFPTKWKASSVWILGQGRDCSTRTSCSPRAPWLLAATWPSIFTPAWGGGCQ